MTTITTTAVAVLLDIDRKEVDLSTMIYLSQIRDREEAKKLYRRDWQVVQFVPTKNHRQEAALDVYVSKKEFETPTNRGRKHDLAMEEKREQEKIANGVYAPIAIAKKIIAKFLQGLEGVVLTPLPNMKNAPECTKTNFQCTQLVQLFALTISTFYKRTISLQNVEEDSVFKIEIEPGTYSFTEVIVAWHSRHKRWWVLTTELEKGKLIGAPKSDLDQLTKTERIGSSSTKPFASMTNVQVIFRPTRKESKGEKFGATKKEKLPKPKAQEQNLVTAPKLVLPSVVQKTLKEIPATLTGKTKRTLFTRDKPPQENQVFYMELFSPKIVKMGEKLQENTKLGEGIHEMIAVINPLEATSPVMWWFLKSDYKQGRLIGKPESFWLSFSGEHNASRVEAFTTQA